jgi:hypothetical protein
MGDVEAGKVIADNSTLQNCLGRSANDDLIGGALIVRQTTRVEFFVRSEARRRVKQPFTFTASNAVDSSAGR